MRGIFSKALLISTAAGLAGAGYMLFEAQWLKLRRRAIELPGLPRALDGLKLLHISDLHAGTPGPSVRAISKIIERAGEASPDIVFFTGDMTDKKKDISPYIELLSRVEAPFGKFAVLGNHDHGLRKTVIQDLTRRLTRRHSDPGKYEVPTETLAEIVSRNRRLLALAGINLLENECIRLSISGENVQICGVDDYQYGYADLPQVAGQVDHEAGLRVLLSHSPDIVEIMPNGDYHLVLAGHTHGGQICIPHPTKGKILLSSSGSSFGTGVYRFPNLVMHVSPGVGTTLIPFRLLSRPEITLLEMSRKH